MVLLAYKNLWFSLCKAAFHSFDITYIKNIEHLPDTHRSHHYKSCQTQGSND